MWRLGVGPLVTDGFPSHMASNAKSVSTSWRHIVSAPTAADVNLIKGKQTWQQSIYSGYTSDRAADGRFSTVIGDGSCAMTNNHHHAWWAVDLEKSYRISHVILTNRDSSRKSPGQQGLWGQYGGPPGSWYPMIAASWSGSVTIVN